MNRSEIVARFIDVGGAEIAFSARRGGGAAAARGEGGLETVEKTSDKASLPSLPPGTRSWPLGPETPGFRSSEMPFAEPCWTHTDCYCQGAILPVSYVPLRSAVSRVAEDHLYYARTWLQQRSDLRPRTVEMYSSMLRNHLLPTFGSIPIKRLSPAAVRSWNAELARCHPVTAAKAYRLLKGILATAVTDELVGRNPCMVKGAAQERSPERPMVSIAEVDALVTAMPERWRIAVELAAWCHLRVGEVLGLERRDIDLLHGAVRVERTAYDVNGRLYLGPPKTAAGKRVVSVPPHILPVLERHLEAHVSADPGTPLLTGQKVDGSAGIPFTPPGVPPGSRSGDRRSTSTICGARDSPGRRRKAPRLVS